MAIERVDQTTLHPADHTAEVVARARRAVASMSDDAAECAVMLDMLGIGFGAEEIGAT